jgi:hypothetical protein
MKKALVFLALLLVASAASAQQYFTPTGSRSGGEGSFSIGPRYSNYSTDVEIGIDSISSGRQHSFGLVGGYRSGSFVLDFLADHDPENGIDIIDIFPGVESYSRDRAEVTVGWSVLPSLDIQGGVRMDDVTIGGFGLGSGFFDVESFEFQGLVLGANVHTPQRQSIGAYGLGRFYQGTGEFSESTRDNYDTSGWRFEGGVLIPLGQSQWTVVPGLEREHLEIEGGDFQLDTNRFFVNFIWTSR